MKENRRSLVTIAGLIVAVCLAAAPARAEATVEPAKGWQFDVTPYLWGAGLGGDVGIGKLNSGGIEASFEDIWNHLHFAAMGTFEVRHDRVGFLVDAVYVDLDDTVPTPDQVLYGDAKVTLTQQLYTGLITYRAYEGTCVTTDVLVGTRYTSLDSTISLTGGSAAGRNGGGEVTWWDWVAGTRIAGHPTKNWAITGYVDIGGSGSDMTWEAIFAASYSFNKHVSLPFGYRYLSIDYDHDKFSYNVGMQGPFLGVGFHW